VSHNIYSTLPREIINKEHKVVVNSNRCLGRSPNIRVNKSRIPSMQWIAVPNFTLVFFPMTQCSQKICRSWHLWTNLALLGLQRFFTCMSEPHVSYPGTIIIWTNRNRHLSCNRITLQVIEVIASDVFHHNHCASKHLENIISISRFNASKTLR